MSSLVVEVAVVALFALACGGLVVAWMRGRLGVAAVSLLVVAVALWVVSFAAITAGSRDGGSLVTCATDCGVVNYTAAVALLAPPLLVSLAAVAMLVSRGSRWRNRRAPAHENQA